MRRAQRELACQKLAFIAVERQQLNMTVTVITQPDIFHPKVIRLSRLGREMSGCARLLRAQNHERLPTCAQVMYSRVDRKIEVRVSVIRSHPHSIHTDARCRFGEGFE